MAKVRKEQNLSRVEFGKRNLSQDFHWEKLYLDGYKVAKPTVFCLSGNGTLSLQDANGFCKQAERFLHLINRGKKDKISDRVDLVGFKYARETFSGETGTLDRPFIDGFVDNTLLPMFTDNSGNRLDINVAMKNMSQVSFFSYCMGANEVNEIIATLNYRLKKLGYGDKEIKMINNATMHVSYAPYDREDRSYLPTVRAISTKDQTVGDMAVEMLKDDGRKLDGIMLSVDKPRSMYGKYRVGATSGGINIISSGLLNAFDEMGNEHYVSYIERDENWQIRPTIRGGKAMQSENADCVSQMMAWALSRAVNNSIENLSSDKYIANNFYSDLEEELLSIKEAFSEKQLAKSEEYKAKARRTAFSRDKYKRNIDINTGATRSTYREPKSVMYAELCKAKTFLEVAHIFERNNYYYLDEMLSFVPFLTDNEKVALKCARDKRAKDREENRWQGSQSELILKIKDATTLEEISYLSQFLDKDNAKITLLSIVDSANKKYPLSYSEVIAIMGKLQKDWEAKEEEKSKPFYSTMVSRIREIEMRSSDTFRSTLDLFEGRNYFGAKDLVKECKTFTDDDKRIVADMAKAKSMTHEFILGKTKLQNYSDVVYRVSSAGSIEEVMEILGSMDYYGVEYILPEVDVLTEKEKKDILDKCLKEREDCEIYR